MSRLSVTALLVFAIFLLYLVPVAASCAVDDADCEEDVVLASADDEDTNNPKSRHAHPKALLRVKRHGKGGGHGAGGAATKGRPKRHLPLAKPGANDDGDEEEATEKERQLDEEAADDRGPIERLEDDGGPLDEGGDDEEEQDEEPEVLHKQQTGGSNCVF